MISEIRPIVTCPMCQGTGRDYSINHHTFVWCDLCERRGWVPLESCMGCGKPAFRFWPRNQQPIVAYCDKEECLTHLVALHKPAAYGGTYKAPVGEPHGLRLGECRLVQVINNMERHGEEMEKLKKDLMRRLNRQHD